MSKYKSTAAFAARAGRVPAIAKVFVIVLALAVLSPVIIALFVLAQWASAAHLPTFSSPTVSIAASQSLNITTKRSLLLSGAVNYQVILFIVFESLFLLVVSACFVRRTITLRLFRSAPTFSRLMLQGLYVTSIGFQISVLSAGLGWGLKSEDACRAAIYICLAFYLAGKFFLYCFLVEQTHILRQGRYPRSKDRLWQVCLFLVIGCWSELSIICLVWPISSTDKGYCAIGLKAFIIIPILIFDIICNLGTCLIFYLYSREQFKNILEASLDPDVTNFFRKIAQFFRCIKPREPNHVNASDGISPVVLLTRKTLFVSCTLLLSTATNLGLLLYYKGVEPGWMFWIMFSFDIAWNALWLTFLTSLPTQFEASNHPSPQATASTTRFVLETPTPPSASPVARSQPQHTAPLPAPDDFQLNDLDAQHYDINPAADFNLDDLRELRGYGIHPDDYELEEIPTRPSTAETGPSEADSFSPLRPRPRGFYY